jgi:hypothetical protein
MQVIFFIKIIEKYEVVMSNVTNKKVHGAILVEWIGYISLGSWNEKTTYYQYN